MVCDYGTTRVCGRLQFQSLKRRAWLFSRMCDERAHLSASLGSGGP